MEGSRLKGGCLIKVVLYQFWILKEYDTNNIQYKFEPDVLNNFSLIWVWKLKILQRMYGLISAFAKQPFCNVWKLISPSILHAKS